MNEGAFAILDCLGFKGIWKGEADPDELLRFLQSVMDRAEKLSTRQMLDSLFPGKFKIATAFVSDTVVLSACPIGNTVRDTEWTQGFAVAMATSMCAEIVRQFAAYQRPLMLRGCVTYGAHLVRGNFFLGPAVDEAATLHGIAQGAFVWLTPEAVRRYGAFEQSFAEQLKNSFTNATDAVKVDMVSTAIRTTNYFDSGKTGLFMPGWHRAPERTRVLAAPAVHKFLTGHQQVVLIHDYPMPTRDRGVLLATVLNPFAMVPASDFSQEMMNRALASFDSQDRTVLLKKQNTQLLFQRCADLFRTFREDVERRYNLMEKEIADIEAKARNGQRR